MSKKINFQNRRTKLSFSGILSFVLVSVFLLISCSKKNDDTNPDETTKTYPTSGLVSYFKFDDNLKDSNNQTPDGTNNGNVTFIEGKSGKAISLSGSNYITFSRKTYKSGNNISISIWFKANHGVLRYFLWGNDFGAATKVGNAAFAISLPNTNSALGDYVADTWTHMVGTYDGTNIKVYINGVLKGTTLHAGNISSMDTDLFVGRFDTEYWKGSLDEFFIYNKVLSQEEVTQLYNYSN
jgi:hypothetical protein